MDKRKKCRINGQDPKIYPIYKEGDRSVYENYGGMGTKKKTECVRRKSHW